MVTVISYIKTTYSSVIEADVIFSDKVISMNDKVNKNTKSKAPKINKPNIKPAFKTKALKK